MMRAVLRRRRRRSSPARSRSSSRRSSATTSSSACRTPKRRRTSRRSTRRSRRAPRRQHVPGAGSRPTAKIQVKDNAPAAIKEAAKEPAKHRTDKATLATFKGGELTVARFPQLDRDRCRRSSRSCSAFPARRIRRSSRSSSRSRCSRSCSIAPTAPSDAEGRGQGEHVLVDRAARGQPLGRRSASIRRCSPTARRALPRRSVSPRRASTRTSTA